MGIRTLLIANRGEIAVRIIRSAREMGIRTVQVHSTADADSLAVRLADEAVEIGPPQALHSYLKIDAVLAAARASGADAIHPGYGFLSENADFAEAVEKAGLVFVGPRSETIRLMGDKAGARNAAKAAGVPVVPGSDEVGTEAEACGAAEAVGFPLLIKASAGGGGRGIRVARNLDEFRQMLPTASAEAKAAFGHGGVYLERLIERARHVEVQLLGDGRNVIHYYERECSLQRRRQKVWEEGPARMLDPQLREAICRSAVALAKSVGYRGAGTIEYLVDDATGDFFFIEMNTRIQVEHAVTELVTGIDLVREMLMIAGGTPLRQRQEDIAVRGHAIEVRINAEDPKRNFMPQPGKVGTVRVPGGPGVRFDTLLYAGYTIPPFYDSLLGKLIVLGEDREHALDRLKNALRELDVADVATTKSLFEALVDDPAIRAGAFNTQWLETWLQTNEQLLGGPSR